MDALELKLLLEFKAGQISAFKKLFEIYAGKIFFFINSYTHNKETTEELVQDVFIKLWNNREKLDPSKSVKSFIFTVAKNHAIDFVRKNNVKIYSLDIVYNSKYSAGNLGEDKLLYDEQEKIIREAIEHLSPRKKEVFELNRSENLTYKQIAEQLGISISAVEKNISSALQDIRNFISKKTS